jgi:hypothetical protein
MIATFLAPMFLAVTGGDYDQARAAAIATVRSCTARNPMDLLLIGQMIALGLATLSSVGLSMAEELPITLILRLRGNAVSLHRTSEHCRRALPEPSSTAQHAVLPDIDQEAEAVTVQVTQTSKPEFPASFSQPPVTPNPYSPPALEAVSPDADLDFPESLDAMKAAMAHIIAESERRAGDAKPAADAGKPAAPPPGAPGDVSAASERILRAAWSYAMPDAAPPAFDDLVSDRGEARDAKRPRSPA